VAAKARRIVTATTHNIRTFLIAAGWPTENCTLSTFPTERLLRVETGISGWAPHQTSPPIEPLRRFSMIRKEAMSLILSVMLALAMLIGLPIANAVSYGSANAASQSSVVLSDDVPTPTPTPGSGTDSNPSGGGNGG